MIGLAIYALCLAGLGLLLPRAWWDPASPEFILILGGIGAWRYGWGLLHLARSLIYRKLVYPRWRRRADALGEAAMPSHVFLLVTSFRIDGETTRKVYQAAIEEAVRCGVRATVIASIVEMADQRLIKRLFQGIVARMGAAGRVHLSFVRIGGTGKRDALAYGFRAVSLHRPPHDAAVCVIDGDSILEPGLLRKSLPYFRLFPDVGAFTTDETCEVVGRPLFREWYNMRFAQRHILMSSMGLSGRVLTLTGRMSAFRAEIATDPEFIRTVEVDYIDHWRLGRFKFLTGDDKSSWYFVLKRGLRMIYVPDAKVVTVEYPPSSRFWAGATMLMIRWFGNMLRTNSRAIALGPRRIGWFTWWCIVDQRLSMWTSLSGPTAVLLIWISTGSNLIFLYVYWVALTRFVQTLTLLTARDRVSWTYPFLLYFNQVYGSLVKTYVFFRLDRQKWTRQKTTIERGLDRWSARLQHATSAYVHVLGCAAFVVGLGLYLRAIHMPNVKYLTLLQ